MNPRNDHSSPLSLRSGAFLVGLLAVELVICVYAALFQGGLYREALERRGAFLCGGSVAFALVFFLAWNWRRTAIDRHLLEEYGEECCKPIRNPVFITEESDKDTNDATKP